MSRRPNKNRPSPSAEITAKFVELALMTAISVTVLGFSLQYLFAWSDPKLGWAAVQATMLPPVALLLARRAMDGHLSRNALTFAMLLALLLFWAGVSTIWATNKFEAHKGWLMVAGNTAVAFLALMTSSQRGFDFRRAAVWVSLVTTICAIYAFLQRAGIEPLNLFHRSPSTTFELIPNFPASTFGNGNFAAHFLVPALLLIVGAALSSAGQIRWLLLIGAVTGSAFLLLTQSRGGVLTLLIGLSVLGIAFPLAKRPVRLRPLLISGLAIAAVIAGSFVSGTAQRFLQSPPQGETSTARYRELIWRDTARMIADRPMLGTGIGNYDVGIMAYASESLLQQQTGAFASERVNRAHNDYLDIAAELGLPGLILLLAALACVGLAAWRSIRSGNMAHLGAISAVFATCLYCLIDFPLNNPASSLLFWTLAGALVGTQTHNNFRRPAHTASSTSIIPIALMLWALALPLTLPAHRYLISETLNRTGFSLRNASRDQAAIEAFQQSLRVAPDNRETYPLLTTSLRRTSRLAEAQQAARKWIELEPDFSTAHNTLGFALAADGKTTDSIPCFERALQLAPTNVAAEANLATAYYLLGRHEDAYKAYESAARRNPDFGKDSLRNYADAAVESGHREAAVRLLNEYLKTAPDDREMETKLHRLNAPSLRPH
ncbi:MAG: O-antigen ligase family protein [Candidatus Sumerlaeaceae bacterium]|nr:O-antigen ligase family protein [Candidatus Sumerlaeaceae bacterium]